MAPFLTQKPLTRQIDKRVAAAPHESKMEEFPFATVDHFPVFPPDEILLRRRQVVLGPAKHRQYLESDKI